MPVHPQATRDPAFSARASSRGPALSPLDVAFSALADPIRRSILSQLARGEATVNELAAPLPVSQPAVSRHLKLLTEAGLIERRVDGNRRPCRLSSRGVESVDAYLEHLREALSCNYARLDALMIELQKDQGTP